MAKPETTITAEQAVRLLDCTPRWIRQLAKDGWIERAEHRRYPLVGAVQGYIRHLLGRREHRQSRGVTEGDLKDGKRREIAARLAAREADIIDLEDVDAFVAFHMCLIGELLSAALGEVPVELRGAVKLANDAALGRALIRWQDARAKLKAGLDPLGDPPGE